MAVLPLFLCSCCFSLFAGKPAAWPHGQALMSALMVLADVMELQQQFEQDKQKIADWKASRRFKPY